MTQRSTRSLLTDLLDLRARLSAEEALDDRLRLKRDRGIGRDLAALCPHPLRQLRAWLRRAGASTAPTDGARAAAARGTVSAGLVALGLVIGWGVAAVVFHYDGTQPINVVHVLAVFVAAQLLLLGVTLILTAPLHRLPVLGDAQALLGRLSPGRLGAWAMSKLWRHGDDGSSPPPSGGLAGALGEDAVRWQLLAWSQLSAAAFNVGALLAFVYLFVLSDLAFAWSTTLGIGAEQFGVIAQALSLPWRELLPVAVPTPELVQATRFFRLNEGMLPDATGAFRADPAALGQWWPFLLACMLCYGLLPRLLLLALALTRLRVHLRRAIVQTPGAAALLERMNAPLVETRSPQAETVRESVQAAAVEHPCAASAAPGARAIVVQWAGIGVARDAMAGMLRRRAGLIASRFVEAGGTTSLEQDADALALASSDADVAAAVLVVKSWEPPVLEVLDFVRDLLAALNEHASVIVAPLDTDQHGGAVAASAEELELWRRAVEALSLPRARVVDLAGELS